MRAPVATIDDDHSTIIPPLPPPLPPRKKPPEPEAPDALMTAFGATVIELPATR
jgi:hypothetical protein